MLWLWRVVFLVLLGVLSWSGWQLYIQQQQVIQQLQQDQKTMIRQLGDLNDRLVAVARMQPAPSIDLSVGRNLAAPEQAELLQQNIRQSLRLAQAALQDGRQEDADALLLNVQVVLQSPAQQLLAPALVLGLQQAVQADRVQLGQTAQLRQTARQSMDRALLSIQQQLDQMARQSPLLSLPNSGGVPITQSTTAAPAPDLLDRLAQMASIERVPTDRQVTLAQRALLCREVALTLGLARHAVRQQQPDQLRALLNEAARQLSRLPDAEAVQARQWLEQLMASPLPPVLPLTALSILPERAPS